jgi:hypothetical protein
VIKGFVEFEFDLPGALLHRLVEVFANMSAAPLTADVIGAIDDAQGVYQLFLDGELSYIGKTDAEAGLRKRLLRHAAKIQHRFGLDPARVTFRAVRVFVFTAVDLETQLIKHYNAKTWNGSGFGSNDPGRERDTTTYKEEHFDACYPIDIDRSLPALLLPEMPTSAAKVLAYLRENLPYTFRAQNAGGKSRKPHPDLCNPVAMPECSAWTARAVITSVVRQLPAGWQAVKLPSHVILYKEKKDYPSGELLARS